MTNYQALLIPYDEMKPVEEIVIDDGDFARMRELVCTNGSLGTLDFASFRRHQTQLVYDDLGLRTQPNNTNVRAMKLWAHLTGMNLDDYRQPLVGNFIVLGLDQHSGETLDVSNAVRYFFGEEGVRQV